MYKEKKLDQYQLQCFSTKQPKEELYDVEKDPEALNNLANNTDYAGQLAHYRGLWMQWALDTNDKDSLELESELFQTP